jgi:hypothetical protein
MYGGIDWKGLIASNLKSCRKGNLLFRYQGLRHTPRMHRSLQAYCATLNPPSHNFGRFTFRRQVPPRPQDARDPTSERWNFVGENCPIISPKMSTSTLHVGIFYIPKICDMGPTALLTLRRKACWGFFALKNPTASAGLKPVNLGTKVQHAYP